MSKTRAHELFVKMHQAVDDRVSFEVKISQSTSKFPNSRPRTRKIRLVHRGCRVNDNEENAWWTFSHQHTSSLSTSGVVRHD